MNQMQRQFFYLVRSCRARWFEAKVFVRALRQKRPRLVLSFEISQINLSEGLRAACSATTMLLIGEALHDPTWSWAAIGAFWTCLVDAAGTNKARLFSMLGFALLSTAFGGLAALAAAQSVSIASLAVLIIGTLAGFSGAFGAATYQVGIIAAVASIVILDRPIASISDTHFLMIYLIGCIAATALSFSIWRIHPFGLARESLRAVYTGLSDYALDCAKSLQQGSHVESDFRRQTDARRATTTEAFELARLAFSAIPPMRAKGRSLYSDLLARLTEAQYIFAYIVAVVEVEAPELPNTGYALQVSRKLARVADALQNVSTKLATAGSRQYWPAIRRLERSMRALQLTFIGLEGKTVTYGALVQGDRIGPVPQSKKAQFAISSIICKNLSLKSVHMQHAVRVGVAATVTFAIVKALDLAYGYWATMAALLILQPGASTTWPRSAERSLGSVLGGIIATGIGLLNHSALVNSLLVFPLLCATMALRRVNYTLYVIFLTPSFILVAEFARPAKIFTYAIERIETNLLGCVIAFICSLLLWPKHNVAAPAVPLDRAGSTGS